MKMHIQKYVILTVCLLVSTGVIFAQSDAIITIPISGELVIAQTGENLVNIDTMTGDISFYNLPSGAVLSPSFNSDGTGLVYGRLSHDHTILDMINGGYLEIETFAGLPPDDLFLPYGWSSDDANILYWGNRYNAVSEGLEIIHNFYLFDIATQELSPLNYTLTVDELLPGNTPLPSNVTSAYLSAIPEITRNPVFDEWIALDLKTTDVADLDDPNDIKSAYSTGGLTIMVLWNYSTDEMILVNEVIPETVFGNPNWSQDGTQLSVESLDTVYILDFVAGATPAVSLTSSAAQKVEIEAWLGIDDLLINGVYDESPDYLYTIAQVINNQWYETEFFRVSQLDYPGLSVGGLDWRLTADEAERHQLSCLFDQAMPTRIGVGQRARVNFTDGTPLRLRSEPSLDAAEITQMPEGTEFDIIGGSACVNSSDYYRFWQIELDDGTIGWAAEAGMSDYFMEPVSSTVVDEKDLQSGLVEYRVTHLVRSGDGTMLATLGRTELNAQGAVVHFVDFLDANNLEVIDSVDIGTGKPDSLVLSPNGEWIAYHVPNVHLVVRNRITGQTEILHPSKFAEVVAIDWSPTDGRLAYAVGSGIFIRQLYGNVPHRNLSTDNIITAVAWKPDGNGIAATTYFSTSRNPFQGRSNVLMWDQDQIADASDNSPVEQFSGGGGSLLIWNPSGTKLANAQAGGIAVFDAQLGQDAFLMTPTGENVSTFAWSPDGTQLAGGGTDSIWIWDIATQQIMETISVNGNVSRLIWSPTIGIIHNGSEPGIYRNGERLQ